MGKPRKQRWCANYYPPDPDKTDKDIVNDYIYRYNINKEKFYKLLTNSKKTRRHKSQETSERNGTIKVKTPPRPQNRFILYRRFESRSPKFKKRRKEDRKVKLTSKEIAILWKNETEEVKKVFCALERMVKIKHREVYGDDYKYKKKKRGSSISSDNSSTESLPYYQASQSSIDSISSNMSLHTLGDSTSSNLNSPNQNMMNDAIPGDSHNHNFTNNALGDSTSPSLNLPNQNLMIDATSGDYLRSYNYNFTNNTLGDTTSLNLNLPNQNMMNDATFGDLHNHDFINNILGDSTSPNLRLQNPNLMNADAFRDSTPPNLISQNQNIMNDATSGDCPGFTYILEDSTSSSSQNYNLPNYVSTLPDLFYDQDNLNNYANSTSPNNDAFGFCTQQSSNFDSTDPFEPDYMVDNTYLYFDFIVRQLLESNLKQSVSGYL